jgi:hypothetical protein
MRSGAWLRRRLERLERGAFGPEWITVEDSITGTVERIEGDGAMVLGMIAEALRGGSLERFAGARVLFEADGGHLAQLAQLALAIAQSPMDDEAESEPPVRKPYLVE